MFSQTPQLGATGCDSSSGGWYYDGAHLDHKDLWYVSERTQCGDLVFGNESDSVIASWSPEPDHNNLWNTWWAWSRLNNGTFTDPVAWYQQRVPADSTVTASSSFTLATGADGVGFNLHLEEGAQPPAAPSPTQLASCYEMCAHLWAHMVPPDLDSVRLNGTARPQLFWHNHHNGRSYDETHIYRNGAAVITVYGSTTSYTDALLPAGSYAYYLRHGTSPITGIQLSEIAWPASDTSRHLSATVQPFVTAIQGMSIIINDSTYQYETQVDGGTTPYHYAWTYQRFEWGYTYEPVPVGDDSPIFETYIPQEAYDWWIVLTDSVSDAQGRRSVADYLVYVLDYGRYGRGVQMLALESLELLGEDGQCHAVPSEAQERQAWLRALVASGRRPEWCESVRP
jgi:hypothetical protein